MTVLCCISKNYKSNQLFIMQRIVFFMLLSVMSVFPMLAQETITVNGIVVDASTQEPLIGASILIKGTTTGTMTGIDGDFNLNATVGSILEISYIGYTSAEVKVPASGEMNISLNENTSVLDEVIVVGAAMKKADLTGSVSYLDAEKLNETPSTTVAGALQGKMAGLMVTPSGKPGEDATVRVRGTNTINSGSSPIYVIDGLVMDGDFGSFNSINPEDVESIQVLKDASATAIYGSRGANGVILVTTKKGRKGEGKVTYDGWVQTSHIAHRPKTMNARQLGDLRIDAFANGYMHSNPEADRNAYIQQTLLGTTTAFSAEELATYQSGDSYDWLDRFTQTGVTQNHTLSFSNGGDKYNLFASFNFGEIKGITIGTKNNRYSGRLNLDTDIKPWLRIGSNTQFSRSDDKMPVDEVFNQAMGANPLLNPAPYQNPDTRYTYDYLTLYYRAHTEGNNNDYNPYNSLEVDQRRVRDRLISSNYININPIEGLNIRSTFAFDLANQTWMEFTPNYIQQAIRHYNGDARAKHERWTKLSWQWDNTATYRHTFGEMHHTDFLFGTSASRNTYNYTKAQGDRFASNDLGYNDLGGAAANEKKEIGSDFYASTLLSYLIRANYNYDHRYFLTATARYDGSSKFGPGHKWGIFPSFSANWAITNEKFMEDQRIFDNLKLRVGYGIVGNQDIENYVYATMYYSSVSNGSASYASSGLLGNPLLTWEKQKQTNLGLDMAFLDNRLRLSIDGFFIKNDNLLMKHSLALTSGYSEQWENIGSVTNKGFEMTLNATPIELPDFTWNISANLSLDHNKVNKLHGDVERILNGTERTGNIFLNESLNSIYTLKCGGIATEANRHQWEGINYNGKNVEVGDLFALDQNGDKFVDQNDRVIVGCMDPKVYGGFSTDFSWKGLTLNAIFNYSIGGKKISDYYESLISSTGTSMASIDLLDRFSAQNPNGSFPRAITNTASGYNPYYAWDTDFALQSTSYLRLATLTLSYNLPKEWIQTIHCDNIRVYTTGSNLFTATKYKGFDPETGDYGYPATRSFTFGLNLTF